MILHLVRHPRPIVPANTCYGRLDVPADGVEASAERLRGLLSPGLPVWSSPLSRCLDLARRLHPRPQVDHRLAEMNFGDWEGKTWDEIGAEALDRWAQNVAGFTPPGGESAVELQTRALDFVKGLQDEEAVLVTHAGVQRMLLVHWLQVPVEQWTSLTFGYGTVTTIEIGNIASVVRCLNR